MSQLKRQYLPEFEALVDYVLEVKEKVFFEQFPEAKDAYKEFKKSVDVLRYSSEEPEDSYNDKTSKVIPMERPDYLVVDLLRQQIFLKPIILKALKHKRRQDEKAALLKECLKNEKMWTKALERGEITQEFFDDLKRRSFKPATDSDIIKALTKGY